MTIYDTPAIIGDNEDVLLALCQDARRIIVTVDKAGEWDNAKAIQFARRVDAKSDRTIQLYTHFKDYVRFVARCRRWTLFFRLLTPFSARLLARES